jgi:recombinational DNA repair ATPase RecF
MQITRFFGTDIHGYLNFDVRFNAGLTFLTGINGSGKTSVIQSIIALISPSFFVLANLNFKTIRVELIHDDRPLT